MKYVIVGISGSQFRVKEGQSIEVNRLPAKEGEIIEFDKVLLLTDEKGVDIGRPYLLGVKVKGRVLKHFRDKKVVVAKFKAKTGYRRKMGFRPSKSLLAIEEISS